MFWLLGGAGLDASQAAALNSFILLGTTPVGYHLAKNSSGLFVNTVDTGAGGSGVWGAITGTLSDQTDLQAALNAKFTLPSLTVGSVLFSDGSTIAQDNASFFWDNTNNRLGIGTSTPSQPLHVRSATDAAYLRIQGVNDGDNFAGFELFNGDGSKKSQVVLTNAGDTSIAHYDGASWGMPLAVTDTFGVQIGLTGSNSSKYLFTQESQLLTIRRAGGTPTGSEDAWTLVDIVSPAGTVSGDQEATLALSRDLSGTGNKEFIDFYNNGYTSERQYGLRVQKRGTGEYRDFVFDQYDGTTKAPIMTLAVNKDVLIPNRLLSITGTTTGVFSNAKGFFSQGDTAVGTVTTMVGVAAEVVAGASVSGRAFYGKARSLGSQPAYAGFFTTDSSSGADSAVGYGVFGTSSGVRTGINAGVVGVGSGSTTANVGVIGQATATGGVTTVRGVEASASTSGSVSVSGLYAAAGVGASADTGTAYAGRFFAGSTHSGGANYAIEANAYGGTANYSFYGGSGAVYNAGTITSGSVIAGIIYTPASVTATVANQLGVVFRQQGVTVTDTTSSGTVANASFAGFNSGVFAASNAMTLTNAATVYVQGAPTAGSNVTITNPYSLYIAGGNTYLNGQVTIPTILTANYTTKQVTFGVSSTMASIDANSGQIVSRDLTSYRATNILSAGSYASDKFDLVSNPVSGSLWHDRLAYMDASTCWGTPTFEKYNGSWSSQTLDPALFMQRENRSSLIIDGTSFTGARWMWNSSNVAYSEVYWFAIGFSYSGVNATRTITIESSTDGSTWTQRGLFTGDNSNARVTYYPVASVTGDTYYRLTMLHTAGTETKLSSIRALSNRWGDQGGGSEDSMPFSWQQNKRIFVGAITATPLYNGFLNVNNNTTTASDGIYFGNDTTLYRSASGNLKTDGSVTVGSALDLGSSTAKLWVRNSSLSSAAWTTTGIGIRADTNTYTDTSSSGTVANTAIHVLNTPTIASTSATTYTLASTLRVSAPSAGTNVTITTALAADFNGVIQATGGVFSGRTSFASTTGTLTTDTDGATVTFSMLASNYHKVTLGGNRTLAVSNTATGQAFTILLKQDGTGSRTVTWFSGILWAGGTTPTLTTTANKTDMFTFFYDGTNYYGAIAGQNF